MNMGMENKIVGYLLLVIGLALIIFSALGGYNVLTGKAKPYGLFSFPAVTLDASNMTGFDNQPQAQEMAKQSGQNPKLELISASLLNDTSNVFAHLILMGFLAGIGYKIGALGVMLSRPINVKLKTKEDTVFDSTSKQNQLEQS